MHQYPTCFYCIRNLNYFFEDRGNLQLNQTGPQGLQCLNSLVDEKHESERENVTKKNKLIQFIIPEHLYVQQSISLMIQLRNRLVEYLKCLDLLVCLLEGNE